MTSLKMNELTLLSIIAHNRFEVFLSIDAFLPFLIQCPAHTQ
jgi:hypothetical protein